MIFSCFIKKSSICLKNDIVKQTGLTKLTMTGLKIMRFFVGICLCHRVV